jgi:hypothetical protein
MIFVENEPNTHHPTLDELLLTLQSFKNKKVTGRNDINI